MLNIKFFDSKRKRTESGSIDLTSITIVGVAIIAVLFGGVLTNLNKGYQDNASPQANVEKIASSVQYLMMIDNMDEVLVESGGKLPNVSLVVNEDSNVATVNVVGKYDTIQLDALTDLYNVETTLDGYTVEAYRENPEDSKKTVLATRNLSIDEMKITK